MLLFLIIADAIETSSLSILSILEMEVFFFLRVSSLENFKYGLGLKSTSIAAIFTASISVKSVYPLKNVSIGLNLSVWSFNLLEQFKT